MVRKLEPAELLLDMYMAFRLERLGMIEAWDEQMNLVRPALALEAHRRAAVPAEPAYDARR